MKSEHLTPVVTAAMEVPAPASFTPYNADGASLLLQHTAVVLSYIASVLQHSPDNSRWELGVIMSVALKIVGVPMPNSQTGSCQTSLSTPCTLQTVHLRGTLFTGLTLGMT